jgi:hypothetical protein
LPDADDDDGEHDQDEPHGTDGEDVNDGHWRSAPLLIVRSMNQAAKYVPVADLPVSTAPRGALRSSAGVAAPDPAREAPARHSRQDQRSYGGLIAADNRHLRPDVLNRMQRKAEPGRIAMMTVPSIYSWAVAGSRPK